VLLFFFIRESYLFYWEFVRREFFCCGNFVLLSSEVGILRSPVLDLFWG
jgi:hypothetical protein